MAGLLTHLAISVLGGFIISFFLDWKIGLSFGLGHLLPDFIDFGITSFFAGSLKPSIIITNSYFYPLKILGHSFSNWIIFIVFAGLILFLLAYFGKISKERKLRILIALFFLLAGALLHIWIDGVILETNHWI